MTFKLPGSGIVAGCYVTSGRVCAQRASAGQERRQGNRPKRKLDSLRHIKDEVREMAQGYECGILTQGFNDYQPGDIIEAFTRKQIARAI